MSTPAPPPAATAVAPAAAKKSVAELHVAFCLEHDHVPLQNRRAFVLDERAFREPAAYLEQLEPVNKTFKEVATTVPSTMKRLGVRHLLASDLANIAQADAPIIRLDPSVCPWVPHSAATSLQNTVYLPAPRLALVGNGNLNTDAGKIALRNVRTELVKQLKALLAERLEHAPLPSKPNALLANVDAKWYDAKAKAGAPGEVGSVSVSDKRPLAVKFVDAIAFGMPLVVAPAKGDPIRGVLCVVTEALKDTTGAAYVSEKSVLLARPISLTLKAFNDANAARLGAARAVAGIRLHANAERSVADRLAEPLPAEPTQSRLFLSPRNGKRREREQSPAQAAAPASGAAAAAPALAATSEPSGPNKTQAAVATASRPAAAAAAAAAAASVPEMTALAPVPSEQHPQQTSASGSVSSDGSAGPSPSKRARVAMSPQTKTVKVAAISPRITAQNGGTTLEALIETDRQSALAKLDRFRAVCLSNLRALDGGLPSPAGKVVLQKFDDPALDMAFERWSRTTFGEIHAAHSPANREAVIGASVKAMEKEQALIDAAREMADCAKTVKVQAENTAKMLEMMEKSTRAVQAASEARAREAKDSAQAAKDALLAVSGLVSKALAATADLTAAASKPTKPPASPDSVVRGKARMTALAVQHAPPPDADRILASISLTSTHTASVAPAASSAAAAAAAPAAAAAAAPSLP